MNEALRNIAREMKRQKEDTSADVEKLEMKYLQHFALFPLQASITIS